MPSHITVNYTGPDGLVDVEAVQAWASTLPESAGLPPVINIVVEDGASTDEHEIVGELLAAGREQADLIREMRAETGLGEDELGLSMVELTVTVPADDAPDEP